MALIRELHYILVEYSMECQAVYVTSADNIIADVISRYDFHRFRLVPLKGKCGTIEDKRLDGVK